MRDRRVPVVEDAPGSPPEPPVFLEIRRAGLQPGRAPVEPVCEASRPADAEPAGTERANK